MSSWRTDIKDGVAYIFLDVADKKQNVLSADVMEELDRLLDVVKSDKQVSASKGLVISSSKSGSFIAGADITQIDKIDSPDDAKYKAAEGQRIYSKIESLPFPTVAAINGYCLGGGAELALACTYRVAAQDDKVKIGLPETKLGILPGWGGTQRLPRLIGLANALDLITTGRMVDARKAYRLGLVDRVVAPDLLLEAAADILEKLPREGRPKTKGIHELLEKPFLRKIIFRFARKAAAAKTRGHYPAIPTVIDLIERTLGNGDIRQSVKPENLSLEAEAFGKLVVTDVSRNLRYFFFMDEAQKKYKPYDAEPEKIKRGAVLGAGIMGGGIAWAFSKQGIPVRVKDISEEPLLGAIKAAQNVYKSSVKRRRMTKTQADRAMGLISVGLDYGGFGRADVVVEAVVEKMEIKKAVLAEVEKYVSTKAVIATNTSGLSIDEMATAMERPERFGGLHFFNPVDRMPLVEIIKGKETNDSTVATLFALARKLKKTPILVSDSPGFLVNRILLPYLLEGARMLEEGVPVEQIDKAAETFGMPMGPFKLVDEIGLDIGLHVARHLEESFGDRMKVPAILDTFLNAGFLGKKVGKGFYVQGKGKKSKPVLNEDIYDLVGTGGTRETDNSIRDRLITVMLLEAVRCLEDHVVQRPEEIDVGMIYGTGFPPFRGGLIRWGSTIGYASIIKRVSSFRDEHGERFEAPPMLKDILN
ncbi:MAG: enoyl-CoA hydratase/isomerase family protein [Candidatus Lindowbacteria bacterium]|nr:enoyl-CoA hydratase/isomerase family protein [Candidatus Lindowbacteria bacterium]